MATVTQGAAINAKSLGVALGRVMGAVHARGPKPILANVLLEIGERCSVSATNLECFMRSEFTGEGSLRACVDAAQLAKIAGLSGESLSVEMDGDSLSITGDRARWTLGTMPANEFPKPPEIKGDPISVSAPSLREAIRHTEFSVDTQSSRYALGGIKLEFSEGKLHCVSTDGRRMSAIEVPADGFGDVLCPVEYARKLAAALPDEGSCEVRIAPSWLSVTADDLEFWCLQIEGRFPRWRDVFPSQSWPLFECPASSLLNALRGIFVVDEGKEYLSSKWQVTLDGLEISAVDRGESLVSLPLVTENQTQFSIRADYVADALKVLRDKPVKLFHAGPDRVVTFQSDSYRHVIVPLTPEK